MSHPFDGIDEKLKRAHRHMSELRQSVEQFLDEAPNRFLADFDSVQEAEFRRFHESRQVPLAISVLAGEALYQLRSTLDHVAAVFILKHGGTLTRQTQFPITDHKPVAKQQRERYENQVGQVPVGTPERALIDQLQPYHKGAGFRAYALGILRDLNNHDKHRDLILHVVVVNPKVRVFLGDSAGDEVMTADFDGVSGDVKPGTDMMGFTITDIRRQLVTDVAFPEFGTAENQRVVSSVSFLFQYVRDTVQRFRPLA